MLPLLQAADTDYPPLSALNDYLFCPRRCFLHRVEGIWTDNAHTASGSLAHARAHEPRDSDELPFRTARGLWVVSHQLRVYGVADVVEFHPATDGGVDVPFPIEYKRGRRKRWDNDDVQLCAQAVCLEEMLGVVVPAGAIFNVKSRRRREVSFSASLRQKTAETATRLHELLATSVAPPPVLHPKCAGCSVREICMPDLVSAAVRYRRAAAELFVRPRDET
jgi:CRISPR-associated exonuclease Cas4